LSSSKEVTALVPCRAGSERISNKNTRPFASSSLIQIKLDQLSLVSSIDRIIVSTDDAVVIAACEEFGGAKVEIHQRDPELARSETTTDELCEYFANALDFKHLLWTHVTSPFVTKQVYEDAIEKYFNGLEEGNDSLISVKRTQEFVWRSDLTAVNYDIESQGMWPRTQSIDPLYIINSAIFIASQAVMRENHNRIGTRPIIYEMGELTSFDVDWEEDFRTAELIWSRSK
jgi:CMP-N-acetylneuraminic acid synthetase